MIATVLRANVRVTILWALLRVVAQLCERLLWILVGFCTFVFVLRVFLLFEE